MDHTSTQRRLQSLSIRLDDELRKRLERLAHAEDRPLSYLIRRALRAEAARRERQEGVAA
jgi:predicted transcriptional regulator